MNIGIANLQEIYKHNGDNSNLWESQSLPETYTTLSAVQFLDRLGAQCIREVCYSHVNFKDDFSFACMYRMDGGLLVHVQMTNGDTYYLAAGCRHDYRPVEFTAPHQVSNVHNNYKRQVKCTKCGHALEVYC